MTESVLTPDIAQALVQRLAAGLIESQQERDRLQVAYGDLGLAVELGKPGADKERDKVRRELLAASTIAADREQVLAAARVKHAEALDAAKESIRAEAWQQVEKLLEQRSQAGASIEMSAAKLTKDLKELREIDKAIYRLLPESAKGELTNALSENAVVLALKEYLFKLGSVWAYARCPWAPDQIKPFSQVIEKLNGWVLSHRSQGGARQ